MQKLTIGLGPQMTVAVESDDIKELIKQAAFFTQLPKGCPICKTSVTFTYRKPKGFEYYGLQCTGETIHELTFGIHQNGGGLYYKENGQWTVKRKEAAV